MRTAEQLLTAPASYADWLRWLGVLRVRALTNAEQRLLCSGTCGDLAGAVPYLEQQVIETVNIMAARCIRQFRRALNDAALYHDHDAVYGAFLQLADQLRQCTFFLQMQFLPQEFRQSLHSSVKAETGNFWEGSVRMLRQQCLDGDTALEDVYYMIRRIRLYP